jgi:hypothetical protein
MKPDLGKTAEAADDPAADDRAVEAAVAAEDTVGAAAVDVGIRPSLLVRPGRKTYDPVFVDLKTWVTRIGDDCVGRGHPLKGA